MTYYGTRTVYSRRLAAGEYSLNNGLYVKRERGDYGKGWHWVVYNAFGARLWAFQTYHDAVRYLMDR